MSMAQKHDENLGEKCTRLKGLKTGLCGTSLNEMITLAKRRLNNDLSTSWEIISITSRLLN